MPVGVVQKVTTFQEGFLNAKLPGGDPDPLEQLELPMDENPEDDGLLVLLLFGATTALALVDLLTSVDDTDNDVLKWCLLPARTENEKWMWSLGLF